MNLDQKVGDIIDISQFFLIVLLILQLFSCGVMYLIVVSFIFLVANAVKVQLSCCLTAEVEQTKILSLFFLTNNLGLQSFCNSFLLLAFLILLKTFISVLGITLSSQPVNNLKSLAKVEAKLIDLKLF